MVEQSAVENFLSPSPSAIYGLPSLLQGDCFAAYGGSQ